MHTNSAESAPEPLLSAADVRRLDADAETAGIAPSSLMEAAGSHVADAAGRLAGVGAVTVLAGPGRNGGDGFVAARVLGERGRDVRVLSLEDPARLDRRGFRGSVARLAPDADFTGQIVIDALFGVGLSRDVGPLVAEVAATLVRDRTPVLAVDLPSGVDADTGAVRGAAIRATRTVTFEALKPGHLLYPGRAYAGTVEVARIGIPLALVAARLPTLFRNAPALFRNRFPQPRPDMHKYDRGHAIVVSGPLHRTGAARLAAMAALRAGAGLVTVASPRGALLVNACHLTAIMLKPFDGPEDLAALLSDRRITACALGPGLGTQGEGGATRDLVAAAFKSNAALVLDADALTAHEEDPSRLWLRTENRGHPVVLTPHGGEFRRLFPDLDPSADKVGAARAASVRSGAIVILKGADTVIAAPDGRAAISDHGPPWLATAGTGDVLAGIVAGLLAQSMLAFEAASAAVWLHADAACRIGPGLIAEDLPRVLPAALRALPSAVNDEFTIADKARPDVLNEW